MPFTTSPTTPSQPSAPSSSPNKQAQSRKDRTCKGKRYLEILNESKLTKRNRTNCSSSGGSANDEGNSSSSSNNKNINNTSSNSSTSKWVTGGFDLEEHIAALPQLGDTHLLSALSHSKANKGITNNNGKGHASNHLKENLDNKKSNENNIRDENFSDFNQSELSDAKSRDKNQHNANQVVNSKHNGDSCNAIAATQNSKVSHENGIKRNNSASYKLDGNRVRTASQTGNNRNDSAMTEEKSSRSNEIRENGPNGPNGIIHDANPSHLLRSQGIECDGLAALAEVALQASRNSIS